MGRLLEFLRVLRLRFRNDAGCIEGEPVLLAGLSHAAQQALEWRSWELRRFPFRIGRRHGDWRSGWEPLDLALDDEEPYVLSRNHCRLSYRAGRFYIEDDGSRLGFVVDGQLVGGPQPIRSLLLEPGEHRLALGRSDSPFQLTLRIPKA